MSFCIDCRETQNVLHYYNPLGKHFFQLGETPAYFVSHLFIVIGMSDGVGRGREYEAVAAAASGEDGVRGSQLSQGVLIY